MSTLSDDCSDDVTTNVLLTQPYVIAYATPSVTSRDTAGTTASCQVHGIYSWNNKNKINYSKIVLRLRLIFLLFYAITKEIGSKKVTRNLFFIAVLTDFHSHFLHKIWELH